MTRPSDLLLIGQRRAAAAASAFKIQVGLYPAVCSTT